jgi:hypothetical protein
MPKTFLIFLFLCAFLCTTVPGSAQSLINNFTAQAQGESYILLKWDSGIETDLASFQVERSFDEITYSTLMIITPQGSNSSYTYADNDIYRGNNRTYYYRVRAQMNNNNYFYSPVQSVVLFFSGIQQTWGSIKALFR